MRHSRLALAAAVMAGIGVPSGPLMPLSPMVTPTPVDPHYKPRRRNAKVPRQFPRSQSAAKAHSVAKRRRKLALKSKRRNRA